MRVTFLLDFLHYEYEEIPNKEQFKVIEAEVQRLMKNEGIQGTICAEVRSTCETGIIGVHAYDPATRVGCAFYVEGSRILEPEDLADIF